MISNNLSSYFEGVNFITPNIIGYFKTKDDIIVEVSHSRDSNHSLIGKLTGVTIVCKGQIILKSFATEGHLTIEEAKTLIESKVKECNPNENN